MRLGWPISPLFFNKYVIKLSMKVAECKQGFKYLVVNKYGVIEENGHAGFLYADDVWLMARNGRTCKRFKKIKLVDALVNMV